MKYRVYKFLRRTLSKIGLCLKSDLDFVYKQRDIAAMMAAKFAENGGHSVSMYRDTEKEWDEEWQTVLQIDWYDPDQYETQVSWHMSPKSQKYCEHYFTQCKCFDWDGTNSSKEYNVIGSLWGEIHTR